MRRYLVVANQTLGGEHLARKVSECLREGPCFFYIVVPATPPRRQLTYTDGEATAVARRRLEAAIARFSELGAAAAGEVGDQRPLDAIRDAILGASASEGFDGVFVSTLPRRASRWLKMDLPGRVRAEFRLPVTHLIGEPELSARYP